MLESFMIYDALGISEERAVEIVNRMSAAFATCDNDMLKLCKAVAAKHDPEAVLIGVLIDHICEVNDTLQTMDEKTTRRRRFS